MQKDEWGKVELKLADFDRAVEVGKIDDLVVYVAAFCFGGALGEPTINPGVDYGEYSGYEVGIVCTLGLLGGEIGGNLWLPVVEAYSEQGGLAKKQGTSLGNIVEIVHHIIDTLWYF